MDTFGMIILLISFLLVIIFAVSGLIAVIKKNGTAKKKFKLLGSFFVLSIVGFIIFALSTDSTQTTNANQNDSSISDDQLNEQEETQEEIKAREEKEEEEKKKAEEEAKLLAEKEAAEKAKAEAEEKERAEKEAKEKAEAEEMAKKEEENKKNNAQPIEYARLKKNPDRYAGEYVKYEGEIIQIMEGDDITQIRLAVTKDSYGWNSNDIIFVEYQGITDFIEEDVVTVYGEIYGEFSYTSQAGWDFPAWFNRRHD